MIRLTGASHTHCAHLVCLKEFSAVIATANLPIPTPASSAGLPLNHTRGHNFGAQSVYHQPLSEYVLIALAPVTCTVHSSLQSLQEGEISHLFQPPGADQVQ